jgi:hypothetical protein
MKPSLHVEDVAPGFFERANVSQKPRDELRQLIGMSFAFLRSSRNSLTDKGELVTHHASNLPGLDRDFDVLAFDDIDRAARRPYLSCKPKMGTITLKKLRFRAP